MGRYSVKAIRLYKEASVGVKPASPNNLLLSSSNTFGLQENTTSEDIECIGDGGEASGVTYGASTFGGDLGFTLTGELMPIILNYLVGASTKTAATTDVWATGVAYTVGDIVNHSDTTHTLVCSVAGTSHAATEPDLTGLDEYDTIVDNTVTWTVRPTLQKYTGVRESCLPTFGVEIQMEDADCSGGTGDDAFIRYEGCYMNTGEFGKSGGDISLKSTIGIMASKSDNSMSPKDGSYEAQAGTDTALNKEFYTNCALSIYLDGVRVQDTSELKISYDRSITEEIGIDCEQGNIVEVGAIKIKGNTSLLFGIDEYTRGEDQTSHELKLIYDYKGDVTTIIHPITKFGKTPPVIETSKFVKIAPEISCQGTSAVPSINYESISGLQAL